jgi:hypothetical protein
VRKSNTKQRMHLKEHARWCLWRSLVWKEWKRAKRAGTPPKKVMIFRDGQYRRAWAYSSVPMPEVFCLEQNTAETLAFLEGMRRTIWQEAVQKRKLPPTNRRHSARIEKYFDFKPIASISPTAALVLASIYDRRKHLLGYKPHTIDEHLWHPNVTAVLRSVGFHELLDMLPQAAEIENEQHIRVLKFLSGEKAEGESLGRLQEKLGNLLPPDERDRLLYAEPYGGMLEAALNSHMWAYPPDHKWDFPILPRWWMTGAIDTTQKTVTVAVYDQGVSIPASLPRWKHWGRLEKMLRRLSGTGETNTRDDVSIRLAMAISRSATNLPQHGKGLHTMLEVVERARAGRLRILSNKGEYIWEHGRKIVSRNYEHSIGGTLIEWRIQV